MEGAPTTARTNVKFFKFLSLVGITRKRNLSDLYVRLWLTKSIVQEENINRADAKHLLDCCYSETASSFRYDLYLRLAGGGRNRFVIKGISLLALVWRNDLSGCGNRVTNLILSVAAAWQWIIWPHFATVTGWLTITTDERVVGPEVGGYA